MTKPPEIESIYRLTVGPNDRLAVVVKDRHVTREMVNDLAERFKEWTGLPPGRVIILSGIELVVLSLDEA